MLKSRAKSLAIFIPLLFVMFAGLIFAVKAPSVSAATAGFYNQPGDSRPDSECNEGDIRLSPGIQFSNPGAQRGIVYYCMHAPNGSVTLNESTVRQGSSCPFGYGGADLGGFGFHCIPNDTSNGFYSGGSPTLDESGGGTFNDSESLDAPEYVESDCKSTSLNQDNCGIIKYIVLFINILSALVGVVVVGSIIFGGIQYSAAGSDPQKVSAAKNRIRNAIIALIFFIFTYSILNYLVPGGVL